VHFARFHLDIDGGLSSVSKVTFASVSIPKDFEVTDVKFIDDKLAIVILHNEGIYIRMEIFRLTR
jgi:hypothetical protein